jgi:hypothetical protein
VQSWPYAAEAAAGRLIHAAPRLCHHGRMPRVLAAATLAAVLLTAAPHATPSGALGPVDLVSRARLERHVRAVAADDLRGRDPLSPGFRAAARYVASALRGIGLTPLGDAGDYLQTVRIRRTRIAADGSTVRVAGETFRHGRDAIATVPGAATGRVVYVGHGWRIPSRGIDPYEGLDVRGALLLVLPITPPGVTFEELGALGEETGWFGPEVCARQLGASGILRVGGTGEIDRWARSQGEQPPRERLSVDAIDARDPPLPDVVLGERALDRLLEGERESGASLRRRLGTRDPGAPFELDPSRRVSLSIHASIEVEPTWNVVAALQGGDPARRDEYVAIGAHLDHIGVRTDAGTGDAINNGADDNGSGVAALLEIARAAAAAPRPPRSLLFVWHTGEEAGGWGARYLTAFPPVPLDRIVAYLNMDMIGRSHAGSGNAALSGPDELYIVGPGRVSPDLGRTIARVNAEYLGLALNPRYDAPGDPERMYERSDHFHYAKRGIPVAFFFSGLHDDYHRPSDEADRIDYEKLEKVARTVLAVAWRLASDPGRPRFDGGVDRVGPSQAPHD